MVVLPPEDGVKLNCQFNPATANGRILTLPPSVSAVGNNAGLGSPANPQSRKSSGLRYVAQASRLGVLAASCYHFWRQQQDAPTANMEQRKIWTNEAMIVILKRGQYYDTYN